MMTSSQMPFTAARPEHRWWILAVLATAQLMVALDATVVSIALPHAQATLHFSNADRQWIVTAYALARARTREPPRRRASQRNHPQIDPHPEIATDAHQPAPS
jgi:hypothetical protein